MAKAQYKLNICKLLSLLSYTIHRIQNDVMLSLYSALAMTGVMLRVLRLFL